MMGRRFFRIDDPEDPYDPGSHAYATTFSAVDHLDDPYTDWHPVAHVGYWPEREEAVPSPGSMRDSYRDGMYNRATVQGTFLSHQAGQVYSAFSDPRMRSAVPTLLGLAAKEHERLTGSSYALPLPDSSLSQHSSHLVHKLRGKGVDVPENPDNPQADWNNTLTFQPLEDRRKDYPAGKTSLSESEKWDRRELRPDEVNAGRAKVRALLHKPGLPEAPRGPQYEQLRIF